MLAAAKKCLTTIGLEMLAAVAGQAGDGLPERTKHAAVLAAVKARPLGVRASGMHCVPAGLDGRLRAAAAVIRGRDEGRACGAVEQRKSAEEAKEPQALSLG